MEFGVALPQFGRFASPEAIVRMARTAEELGWKSVWGSDHIVMPRPYLDRFSGTFYEVFTTLAFVAAHTSRVRLGTSVLLLAYRHPVMIAKQVASLDRLAGGRTIIGVAPGWMPEEFAILGLPFAGRGRRADECLRALKTLWTEATPAFAGEAYRFSDFEFSPTSVQRPHPPLWIGGNDHRALRRTAEFGDGWHPITSVRIGLSLEELDAGIKELRALTHTAGRDPEAITVSIRAPLSFDAAAAPRGNHLTFVGAPDDVCRRLEQCAAIGVGHVVFDCFYSLPGKVEASSVEEFVGTMDQFSRDLRPCLCE